MELYRIDQKNRKSVDDFIMKHWFTLDMVVHGEKINIPIKHEIELEMKIGR